MFNEIRFEDLEFLKGRKARETPTGFIYVCRLLSTGQEVYVKEYRYDRIKSLSGQRLQDYERDVMTLMFLLPESANQHMCKVLGLIEHQKNRLLVFELFTEGSLFEYMANQIHHVTNAQILITAYHIALGLSVFNEIKIVHNGVHPKNIFKRGSNWVLGPPDLLSEEDIYDLGEKRQINYKPPESIESNKLSLSTDIWAYGCLILHLIYFTINSCEERGGVIGAPVEFPREFSVVEMASQESKEVTLIDIASSCLNPKWKDRPAVSSVLNTPVITADSRFFPPSKAQSSIRCFARTTTMCPLLPSSPTKYSWRPKVGFESTGFILCFIVVSNTEILTGHMDGEINKIILTKENEIQSVTLLFKSSP